ncbi:MAG: hypothetical protein NZ553_19800 [Caldilinea sp.]|nr:hypothetical protein [Caldilinea sp.]MDW8442728.1 hypothetical protein [Caldilineaceae bacterium]
MEPIERKEAASWERPQETLPPTQDGGVALRPEIKASVSIGEQAQPLLAENAPAEASEATATNERTDMQKERLSATEGSVAQRGCEPSPPSEAARQRKAATPPVRRDKVYTTIITGRTEWVLVRVVQAMVQFVRQVRSAIAGEDAQRPTSRPADDAALCEDDLTQIAGLTPAHAEQLKGVGVTRYSQLAALTVDELRMMTLTLDAAKPIDYEQWRRQAATLAALQERGRR